MQCQLTRYLEARPMVNNNAETVARLLEDNIFLRYGTPKIFITDGGSSFSNQLVNSMCEKKGIQHHLTTPYNHQSQGKIERAHKTLMSIIKTHLGSKISEWATWLSTAQFVFNTSHCRSIGTSAHAALFGKEPGPQMYPIPTCMQFNEWKEFMTALHARVFIASEIASIVMKRNHDEKLTTLSHREFKVGDKVLIQNEAPANKLAQKFLGPAEVIEKLNTGTYRVRLGEGGRTRKIQSRQMKLFDGSRESELDQWDFKAPEGMFVVESILSHRIGEDGNVEYEVKWYGYPTPTFASEPALKNVTLLKEYNMQHAEELKSLLSKQDMKSKKPAKRNQRPA